MKTRDFIESLPYKLEIEESEDGLVVYKEDWHKNKTLAFEFDEDIEQVRQSLEFLNYTYIKNFGCYKNDYLEILVTAPDACFIDSNEIPSMKKHGNKVYYQINNISEALFSCIGVYTSYEANYLEKIEELISIKIYNIGKIQNTGEALNILKTVLFELQYKYNICLTLFDLPEDIKEKIGNVDKNFMDRQYDKDLIGYYYRANIMNEDEFKYIAFYQVLECIFDEVYLDTTIEDVRQLVNSNWFSTNNKHDLTKMVNIIDQYNNSKNDREKLKLVLEKYFKGNLNNEAYFLANKEIITILTDDLKLIKHEEALDLKKIANILYDFRCVCTHTNRNYPFQTKYLSDQSKVAVYIKLIKKVAEKIILNYS